MEQPYPLGQDETRRERERLPRIAANPKTAAKGTAPVRHLYTNAAKIPVVPGCCWCVCSAYLNQ